jgi:hypothetical protein
MTDLLGFPIGFNISTLVLCAHLLISSIFFGSAVLVLVNAGELLGVALQTLTGTLIVGLGVVTARII